MSTTPPPGPPTAGPSLAPSFAPSFALHWERREPPLPAAAVLAVGDAVPALATATRDRLLDGARLSVLVEDGPWPEDAARPADGTPAAGGRARPVAEQNRRNQPQPHQPHQHQQPRHEQQPHQHQQPRHEQQLHQQPQLLLVLGAEGDLPWADGARYLGREAGLLVPTTARPGPAPALWRRVLGAADDRLCVLVPGHALVADPPPPATAAALEPYTGSTAR
ncbi:hypothetical protein OH807_03670 [Kitasatospora sp. NBC_01560]|uniref:bpX5 domain-containing protein n=1 Tax=Kitasatospora sp. NBC_01560 TaxID=2975965 RepID=UPI00386B4EE7